MTVHLRDHPDFPRRACRGKSVNTFHPESGQNAVADAARTICRSCPPAMRLACLDFAIRCNITEGVWGGATGAERRQIAQVRREAG